MADSHIRVTHDLSPNAELLLRRIVDRLAAHQKWKDDVMATLDSILEAVAAEGTKIDSLNVLMDGIRQQLADALANVGGVTPEMQQKIDDVFDRVSANIGKVDEAITENTPPPAPSTA